MDGAVSQVPGQQKSIQEPYEIARDREAQSNEITFSNLQTQFEEVSRAVMYYEEALAYAKTRQAVLASAMDRLNDSPQPATPSLR